MSKVSIRFYNEREVRAVWDEERSKWWFSVQDVGLSMRRMTIRRRVTIGNI